MKFDLFQIADISTKYITENDARLIENKDLLGHVASLDPRKEGDSPGEILSVFIFSELVEEQLQEFHRLGFSDQFIKIIEELRKQEIPYVRFDADGGDVEGDLQEFDW